MIEAQDRGVKVALVGIEPCDTNQSHLLLREADDHIVLDKAFLSPHITLTPVTTVVGGPIPPMGPTAPAVPAAPVVATPTTAGYDIGVGLAREWMKGANTDEVTQLISAKSANGMTQIPSSLDRELLARGRSHYHVFELDAETKRRIRDGFWDELTKRRRSPRRSKR